MVKQLAEFAVVEDVYGERRRIVDVSVDDEPTYYGLRDAPDSTGRAVKLRLNQIIAVEGHLYRVVLDMFSNSTIDRAENTAPYDKNGVSI